MIRLITCECEGVQLLDGAKEMQTAIAEQIANLLDRRNQLTRPYTPGMVLEHADSYLYEERGAVVVGCIEVRKVQWYQAEVSHLTVAERHEGQGLGRALVRRAVENARRQGARLAQCTIRQGNDRSERTFLAEGFSKTCTFFNTISANNVHVFQKSLVNGSA